MSGYKIEKGRRGWPKALVAAGVVLILFALGTVLVVRHVYNENLQPLNASQKTVQITIPRGATAHDIATALQTKGIIRASWAFEWYVRTQNLRGDLQAGTYALKASQTIPEIVSALTEGKIDIHLVTILPGHRLDQVKQAFINAGFAPADVDRALNPNLYPNNPALADKPTAASLEGYLYPDSYQRTADTKPEDIVAASLTQLQKHLTPELRTAIVKQGLTVHEGIILASMIEQEVSKPQDRQMVAQVFLKRLRQGMPLGSDVTAFYGSVIAGHSPSASFDSPYNTLLHAGLPPGPISNVSDSSLQAVAFPASTDYLYFVSGDDGITYFSHTLKEQEALTAQHCKKLCSQ